MSDDWHVIEGYSNYIINDQGAVINRTTGRAVRTGINQNNLTFVALTSDDDKRTTLSLARLVAYAFLPPPTIATFNTPINLNGRRIDCAASNLMWRPRWFARRYHAQFGADVWQKFDDPVMEIETERPFDRSLLAAQAFGLLASEVYATAQAFTRHGLFKPTWPTGQLFRLIL